MKRKLQRKDKGQAVVEYIIIIVIVAVAALAVLGIFSDRIRTIIAGTASTFGDDGNAASHVEETRAIEILQEMDAHGYDVNQ